LDQLKRLDLGYPLGANEILPPQLPDTVEDGLRRADVSDWDSFEEFYRNCDGLSLPDVHVGYFLKSITKLGVVDACSEPIEIKGEFSGKVLAFGSTGGGGLFVIRRASGDVLHLAPGPLENGIYDGNRRRVRQISGSFCGFLERLMADIQAFVSNQDDYDFIS
jgi:hypothetical protein